MTTEEFSNGFDVLLSSRKLDREFGKESLDTKIEFDEYEKSLFLTKAQRQLMVGLYNGSNEYGVYFENTEEARRYLESHIKPFSITAKESGTNLLSKHSKLYKLPSDLMFITYESHTIDSTRKCDIGRNVKIKPELYDNIHHILQSPFKGPNDRKSIRVDHGNGLSEIISIFAIKAYEGRYLKKPTPIVLDDFVDISVEGVKVITQCELNDVLHDAILELAVALALQTMVISSPTLNKE